MKAKQGAVLSVVGVTVAMTTALVYVGARGQGGEDTAVSLPVPTDTVAPSVVLRDDAPSFRAGEHLETKAPEFLSTQGSTEVKPPSSTESPVLTTPDSPESTTEAPKTEFRQVKRIANSYAEIDGLLGNALAGYSVTIANVDTEASPGRAHSVEDLTKGVNEASSYWQRVTNRKLSFSVADYTEETIRVETGCLSAQKTAESVNKAIGRTAEDYYPYTRRVLVMSVPRNDSCDHEGLATMGAGFVKIVNGSGTVIAHEMGHMVGLGHSFREECSENGCQEYPYGHSRDIMSGEDKPGELTPAWRHLLGMSPAVSGPTGDVSLTALGSDWGGNMLAYDFPEEKTVYYVAYRGNAGLDVNDSPELTGRGYGVEITRMTYGTDSHESKLLSPREGQRYVMPGESQSVHGGRLVVSIVSQDDGTAQLKVRRS